MNPEQWVFGSSRQRQPDRCAAAAAFGHDDLTVNALPELRDMGDHAYEPIALCERAQGAHGLTERILIERAEALVNKHAVELYAARRCLQLLRESERERQRRKKALAAGERAYAPLCAVVGVNHV